MVKRERNTVTGRIVDHVADWLRDAQESLRDLPHVPLAADVERGESWFKIDYATLERSVSDQWCPR